MRSVPGTGRWAATLFTSGVLLFALAWCCGPGEQAPPPARPSSAPAAESAPAAARANRAGVAPVSASGDEPYASAELGALHGTILFEGSAPERFELGAATKPECKHHPEVDQRANVLVVNDGKLAGVLVHLKSGYDEAAVPAAPAAPVTLDQRGCMYVPRVLALQLGQKLLVANSDPTNHNVHTRAKKNDELNKNMGVTKDALEITFEHAEKVPFACDIHPWMGAVVFVEEHPWFAISGADGAFRIGAVPPGEYVVEAVHENLGSVAGSVKVTAGQSTGFTLTLRAKK